jgi:hypothetical protein
MDEDMATMSLAMQSSHGVINGIIAGLHADETIDLDGKVIINATFENCRLRTATGDFLVVGENNIGPGCQLDLADAAHKIATLLKFFQPSEQ